MSFIRPEALRAITARMPEIGGAAALVLLLAWIRPWSAATSTASAILAVLAICAIGWLVHVARLRRALSARGRAGPGPGVVTIDERRIGYFGPETGGFIALDQIDGIEVDARRGGLCWRLRGRDDHGAPLILEIPAGAEQAERLPDAFAALRGFDLGAALAATRAAPGGPPVAVWTRKGTGAISRLAPGEAGP